MENSRPYIEIYEDEVIKIYAEWESGVTSTGKRWSEYVRYYEIKYITANFGWMGGRYGSLIADLLNARKIQYKDEKRISKNFSQISKLVEEYYTKA